MIGVRNIADLTINRSLFRVQNYGFIFGLSGIILGILGVIGGFAAKAILDLLDEKYKYELVFLVSLIFVPFVIYFTSKFRLLEDRTDSQSESKRNPWEVFITSLKMEKLKFATFIHLIRGVFNGVVFFALPIGVEFYSLPLSNAPNLAIIFAVSGIVGNYFIYTLYDRIGTLKTRLIPALVAVIAMICLFFTRDPKMYLVLISFFIFAISVFNWSIPLGVFKITPNYLVSS